MQAIGRGLTLADPLPPPAEVRVGEGSYPEKVTMIEGVNILGGYDCTPLPCTPTRDPATNHSMILDQDFEGVLAPAGITRSTILDGLEITGKAGTPTGLYGAALTVASGGSPTLSHNTVTGGATSTKYSYGIVIPGPGSAAPLISNNVISGGTGQGAAGIAAFTTGSTAVLGNDIRAGTASGSGNAWGMILGGTIQIDSNRINTAASSGSCSTATWCGGIYSASAQADITNNVVLGLPTQRSAALLAGEFEVPAQPLRVNSNYLDGGGFANLVAGSISSAVTLSISPCNTCGFNGLVGKLRNNVLRGGNNQFRYGGYEDPAATRQMHPQALQNNNFFFPTAAGRTDVLYRFSNGTMATNYTTIMSMELNLQLNATGNFQGDCLFDATFHLGAGSLCINAGIATEAPPLDFDGQARPNGGLFDVGPDERYP